MKVWEAGKMRWGVGSGLSLSKNLYLKREKERVTILLFDFIFACRLLQGWGAGTGSQGCVGVQWIK